VDVNIGGYLGRGHRFFEIATVSIWDVTISVEKAHGVGVFRETLKDRSAEAIDLLVGGGPGRVNAGATTGSYCIVFVSAAGFGFPGLHCQVEKCRPFFVRRRGGSRSKGGGFRVAEGAGACFLDLDGTTTSLGVVVGFGALASRPGMTAVELVGMVRYVGVVETLLTARGRIVSCWIGLLRVLCWWVTEVLQVLLRLRGLAREGGRLDLNS
jgi:hypothetical protein